MARRGGGWQNPFKKSTDYGQLEPAVEGPKGTVSSARQVPNDPIVEFRNPMRNNAYRVPGTVSLNKKNTNETNPEAVKKKDTNSTSRLVAMAKEYKILNESKGPATGPIPGKKIFNGKPVNARIRSTQGVSPPAVPNTVASATATVLYPPLTPSNGSNQNSQNVYKTPGQPSQNRKIVDTAETPKNSTTPRTNTTENANLAREKKKLYFSKPKTK